MLAGVQAGIDMVSSPVLSLILFYMFKLLVFYLTRSFSYVVSTFDVIILYVFLQIMVPLNYTEFIDTLTSLVNNNFIPMTRIDDAVRRILRVKFTLGLFENPLADYKLVKHVGSQVSLEIKQKKKSV